MDEIAEIIRTMLITPVSFTHVYRDFSFRIGFGKKLPEKSPLGFNHREYEIVTYESTWRYSWPSDGEDMPLKSSSIEVLNLRFQSLLGRCLSAIEGSGNSATIRFDCGFSLVHGYMKSALSEDVISLLLPDDLCLGFGFRLGWRSGKSSEPWNMKYWKVMDATQVAIKK